MRHGRCHIHRSAGASGRGQRANGGPGLASQHCSGPFSPGLTVERSTSSLRKNIRTPLAVTVLAIRPVLAHRARVLGASPSHRAACANVRSSASSSGGIAFLPQASTPPFVDSEPDARRPSGHSRTRPAVDCNRGIGRAQKALKSAMRHAPCAIDLDPGGAASAGVVAVRRDGRPSSAGRSDASRQYVLKNGLRRGQSVQHPFGLGACAPVIQSLASTIFAGRGARVSRTVIDAT